MIPKKNKKADLEGKKGMFFLFGIALSLTAAIYVLQIERGIENRVVDKYPPTVYVDEFQIPQTIRVVEKMEVKVTTNIDDNLPPEVVPDDNPVLDLHKLFNFSDNPDDELIVIDRPTDEDNLVPIDFVVIENIARPIECEGISNKDAQRECFNSWIQTFIAQHTNYPELAKQIGLEGKVYVNFIISEKGEVEQVTLARGEHAILNNEAMRVLGTMPKMIPGKQRGQEVKMKMTVPVNFKLSNR